MDHVVRSDQRFANSVNAQPKRPNIPISRVLLPPEHGSWSLLIESLVVGFAIAYSPSSPWIALATVAAFFARQPLKTRILAKNNAAAASIAQNLLIIFTLFAASGIAGTALTSHPWTFFPFVIAAPLAVQQFYLDLSTRGRSLMAELAGAVAISSSAAVVGLAGGLGLPNAMALWFVLVARFIPSILYVRNRLLRQKNKDFNRSYPLAAHLLAVFFVSGFAVMGLASFLTAALFCLLLARCVYGLWFGRMGTKAMIIGIWEVVFGVLTVASIIAGYYAGI